MKIIATLILIIGIGFSVWRIYGIDNRSISPHVELFPTIVAQKIIQDPLSIEIMRSKMYPGSRITRESVIYGNASYTKYLVSYQSEGLKIFGMLAIPHDTETKPAPAILLAHGYIPPTQYVNTEKYVAYIDALARGGYVVFMPDYRGHGESEGVAKGAYFSPEYAIDTLNAISSLRTMKEVNAKKIGIWGHSMGGNVAMRVSVIDRSLSTIVIWAGVVGPYQDIYTQFFRNRVKQGTLQELSQWRSQRVTFAQLHGEPSALSEYWRAIDPAYYLRKEQHIQLHHGTTDHTVPLAVSTHFKDFLLSHSIPVELYEYENEDHNINGPAFSTAMSRSVAFFDKYLK